MSSSVTLYNAILNDLSASKQLSEVLPSALILANQIKDDELKKWVQLELNGYYSFNEALTEDVIVPEYRIVPGQYYDLHNRPLIINDPKWKFINEYRLRHAVGELEKLAASDKLLSVQDPSITDILKKQLGVDVHTFTLNSTAITGILQSIKTNLITNLMKIAGAVESSQPNNDTNREHTIVHQSILNYHPLVQAAASKLFGDGHFRQAILDTYILLVDTVKTKSGKRDLDGSSLIQTVFSIKNPLIKISSDPDEQLGFMWLFSGAVMGIRNPKAHRLMEQPDAQSTLEWLAFASALFRILDNAELVKME